MPTPYGAVQVLVLQCTRGSYTHLDRRRRPVVLDYPPHVSAFFVVHSTIEPWRLRVLPPESFPMVRRRWPLPSAATVAVAGVSVRRLHRASWAASLP